MKIAFLGLGIMGRPMASKLVAAGHEVSVWNRSARQHVDGATTAVSPADAAKSFKGVTMGTPDDVAAAIRQWEAIGYDGINFIAQFMEVVPQRYVLDSTRLFAEEVMPQFKGTAKAQRVTAGVA